MFGNSCGRGAAILARQSRRRRRTEGEGEALAAVLLGHGHALPAARGVRLVGLLKAGGRLDVLGLGVELAAFAVAHLGSDGGWGWRGEGGRATSRRREVRRGRRGRQPRARLRRGPVRDTGRQGAAPVSPCVCACLCVAIMCVCVCVAWLPVV